MSEVNVFLEATRLGLRFEAENHGNLTTEQLWTLPLVTTRTTASSLDGAGKLVKKELRELEDEGIVVSHPNELKQRLELKLAVLLAIVEYKQAENAAKVEEQAKASEKAKLREILETKRADALGNLTVEEIEARLKALD